MIGGLASWHWTLVLVAALGAAAFAGILAFMPDVPLPPPIRCANACLPSPIPASDSR
jgi:predicted MFS family arabinose efflux permease